MAYEREYSSPKHRLLRLFKEGRENWKRKCQEAKAALKRHQDNLRATRTSRDLWKKRAKENAMRLAAAEKELAELRRAKTTTMSMLTAPGLLGGVSVAAMPTETVRHHHFCAMTIFLLVSYVLRSISLRASVQVLRTNDMVFGTTTAVPSWWTVRLWVMRLGLYKLRRNKEKKGDRVWIVDHTVQIGEHKCLAIAGLRLAPFERSPRPIVYEDLEPLALVPMTHSNGEEVLKILRETEDKVGQPCQIVADHGSDVKSGIEEYCSDKPTVYTHDIKHLTAATLKRELRSDKRWDAFCTKAAQMRSEVQQTRKAPLAPPKQRSKSRYMNCDELTRWARRSLAILKKRSPSFFDLVGVPEEQAKACLSWMKQYRTDIHAWEEMTAIAETADSIVRHRGIYKGVGRLIRRRTRTPKHERARVFRRALLAEVGQEEAKVPKKRVLVGSSEALESTFGKLKHIEGSQASGGFTGLLLAWAAILGQTSAQVVKKAMEAVKTSDVVAWTRNFLGKTVQGRRKAIAAALRPGMEGRKTGEFS
jgi:hypothetical protein